MCLYQLTKIHFNLIYTYNKITFNKNLILDFSIMRFIYLIYDFNSFQLFFNSSKDDYLITQNCHLLHLCQNHTKLLSIARIMKL